jgi:hypothetical protein
MVRNEFNLGKNEKWVVTKLRMILVRLDVGSEHLQIRKSENMKIKQKKGQAVVKETINKFCLGKPLGQNSVKNTTFLDKETTLERPPIYIQKSTKVSANKHTKSAKNPRKSLESRQLEKLRNIKFADDENTLNSSGNIAVFLSIFKLQSKVICL